MRFIDGSTDVDVLRAVYDRVLVPSFRPAEVEPFDRLRGAVERGDLHGAVAFDGRGEPVGALFAEWFADVGALLLCYFAVRPEARGQGVGRALVAFATPVWRANLRPTIVFAEAEDPRFHSDGDGGNDGGGNSDGDGGGEYGDGYARLRLYEGFGGRYLPIPYVQPEIMPGHGRVPHLLLLVMETAAPEPVDGGLVENFITRYFSRNEGTVRDDEELNRLREACRRPLPLLDLAALTT